MEVWQFDFAMQQPLLLWVNWLTEVETYFLSFDMRYMYSSRGFLSILQRVAEPLRLEDSLEANQASYRCMIYVVL